MKNSKEKTREEARYQKLVNDTVPRSKTLSECLRAFLVGGLICCIGQAIYDFGIFTLKLSLENVAAFASMTLIFLGAFLTGLGVYDKLGAWAGAGSVVPITGFANSIVAPAMEFRREGLIMGLGAKLFTIAGPVLVYGVGASVVIGLISLLFQG